MDTETPKKEALSLDDSETKEEVRMVCLQAKDGKRFNIRYPAIKRSLFLVGLLEDQECKEVTLEKVPDAVLEQVVRWLQRHETVEPPAIKKPLRSCDLRQCGVDDWNVEFAAQADKDQDMMFGIMLCANYMRIEPLLMLMCAKCASMLKDRTPNEIKTLFNIGEHTLEEEEAVRKEHADLFN